MPQFEVEREIGTAPETAFDLMADARNETRWNPNVSSAELVTDEPVGEGSRFRVVNRGQPYDATITRHEPPGRLAFDVSGRAMDIAATFTFAPSGAGTTFRGSFDFRPKGAFRFVFVLMRPMVRRDLARQSASFKALCED